METAKALNSEPLDYDSTRQNHPELDLLDSDSSNNQDTNPTPTTLLDSCSPTTPEKSKTLQRSDSLSSFPSPNASLYSNLLSTSRPNRQMRKRQRQSSQNSELSFKRASKRQERTTSPSSQSLNVSPLWDLFETLDKCDPIPPQDKYHSMDSYASSSPNESSLPSSEPTRILHMPLRQKTKTMLVSNEESKKTPSLEEKNE